MVLSPIFSFAIFLLPLPVKKTKEQLGMIPLGIKPIDNQYPLQMYHCAGFTPYRHKVAHYTTVGIGMYGTPTPADRH